MGVIRVIIFSSTTKCSHVVHKSHVIDVISLSRGRRVIDGFALIVLWFLLVTNKFDDFFDCTDKRIACAACGRTCMCNLELFGQTWKEI